MKVLAFSDIHCNYEAGRAIVAAAASADLVIGAGDFAVRHEGLERMMPVLAPIEDKALYIPGNNETEEALRAATGARVLHGQVETIGGVRIGGIGCAVPPLPEPPWPSFDMDEAAAATMLAGMEPVDVLVTHSPPRGVADRLDGVGPVGSEAVRGWIEAHQPGLVLCGHIHDCWGETGRIGVSEVRNLGPGVTWLEVGGGA